MYPRNECRLIRLALVSALAGFAGTTAHAFVTQSPISFWPVGNVEWKLHLLPNGGNIPNPPLQDGSASWDAAFQVAIDAFNGIVPDNVLTLSAVHASGVAPGNNDGVNNVAFSSTVYGNTWGPNTLGISISYSSGNKRVENDVLFNSTKSWNAYSGSLQGGANDFRRVALHELGHSLGLNHPDQAGQVVSAVMNSTTSSLDALQQDDIDGILSMYAQVMDVVITRQPQSISAPVGAQAGFDVEVTGSENITYSWERSTNGGGSYSPISASSDNFYYGSVSIGQNGHRFRVVVTNPAGTKTSEVATLTVTSGPIAPGFSTHPQVVDVAAGADATFTVVATGSPTPDLQWQVSTNNGANFQNLIEGEIATGTETSVLTVTSVTAQQSGHQFRCMASSTAGEQNSNAATLTVDTGSPPAAPSATAGANSAFNAFTANWQAVAGANGYRLDVATDAGFTAYVAGYQNLDVGNATSVNVPGLTSGTYHYRLRAYNAGGTGVSSHAVSITVGGRMVNLSTRGQTSTGDTVMIAGLAIGGGQAKQLLIRAVGPTLAADPFFLQGTIPDPRLRLQRLEGNTVVSDTVYDNWNSSDAELLAATLTVGAFDLLNGSLDSAILITLQPGSYTAQVETATGATGIAIVEIYETDSVGRLANISTRGFVGTGDAIIIPGTVSSGGPKRFLVRAIGETLGLFGVPGVLVDPVLEIYPSAPPGAGALFTNDDWSTNANAAEVVTVSNQVGAFELEAGTKDAVLLVVLPQGGYTFTVRGKGGATGVALVEVYEVP